MSYNGKSYRKFLASGILMALVAATAVSTGPEHVKGIGASHYSIEVY